MPKGNAVDMNYTRLKKIKCVDYDRHIFFKLYKWLLSQEVFITNSEKINQNINSAKAELEIMEQQEDYVKIKERL